MNSFLLLQLSARNHCSSTYAITYLPCQTCHARIHCTDCEQRLLPSILAIPGVDSVLIQIARKELQVEGNVEEDTLLDTLEELGIFAD